MRLRLTWLAGVLWLALFAIAGSAVAAPPSAGEIGGLGSGAGQLDFPAGITVSPLDGHLFVAEFDNDRISEFTPGGEFVRAFGLDVIPGGDTGFESCTSATGCKAGSGLTQAGGVNAPAAIHAAPNGHLYVTELDAERVSEFDEHGDFVRAWGWDVIPGGDTGFEICTEATGCKNGVTGDGAGQFFAPVGVTTDWQGDVWIAENQNQRVSWFSDTGVFKLAYGYGVDPGSSEPNLCFTEPGCIAGVSGGAAGQFSTPRAVAFAGRNLAVVEQGNNRVSVMRKGYRFLDLAFGFDVTPGLPGGLETCTPQTLCQAATSGAAPGQLNGPRGAVAVDAAKRLLVADTGNDRVNRYTADGQFVDSLGEGLLDDPRGLAIDCRGAIWVGDGGATGLVHRFANRDRAGPCPLRISKVVRGAKGTRLTVEVPSAGRARLNGRGLRRDRARTFAAGQIRLDAVRKRRGAGGRVRVEVKFRPPEGTTERIRKRISVPPSR